MVLTVVTFLYLDDIENPPASGPNGLSAAAGAVRLDRPARAAQDGRPNLTHPRERPAVHLALRLPRREQLFSYDEMVVPTDTTVVLEITASDVIHSWWIPKLGGKADAVPGHVNETWFKVPAGKEGTYRGQCAELCGSDHADMRAEVRGRHAGRVRGLGRRRQRERHQGRPARRSASQRKARAKGRRAE